MHPDDFPAGGYVRDYLGFWLIWVVIILATVVFYRATRGRKTRPRTILGGILLYLALAWTAVVLGETYLRYVYDASDQWAVTLTNVSWQKRHIHLNSKHFRDREFVSTPRPGVVRIGCVGASSTVGWGVKEAADVWPQRLGTLLEQKAPGKYETLNLGRPGASTGDMAALLEQMAPRHVFERVTLSYDLNGAYDLLGDRQFNASKLPRPTWIAPTRSFVVDFLWFHVRLRDHPILREADAAQAQAYDDPKIWDAQRVRFRRIAGACRSASLPLDVVVCPMLSEWGDSYRFHTCHDMVVEAWKTLGVPVIDLRDAYRGIPREDLVVNRYDGHPNERAHDIAARTIAERLIP